MFSTLANDMPPHMEKVMYNPGEDEENHILQCYKVVTWFKDHEICKLGHI